MDDDIYQKQYDFELEQRNHLSTSVNVPVMAITVLGGSLSAALLGYSFQEGLATILFILSALGVVSSLGFAIYFIFRSLLGYEYQKISSPGALCKHYDSLVDWHKKNGGDEENAEADFKKYINDKLAEASAWNGTNNINRGNYVYKATVGIGVSVVFLAGVAGLSVYKSINKPKETYNVQIIGDVNLRRGVDAMSKKESGGKGDKPKETEPQAPVQTKPDPKPEGPPNIIFKSSVNLEQPVQVTKPVSKEEETAPEASPASNETKDK